MTSRPIIHRPRSESDVAEIVMDARAAKTPLAIEGGGTGENIEVASITPRYFSA